MPRFYFHCVGASRIPDVDGLVLPDLETAQSEAVRFAGEVLLSEPDLIRERGQWRVEVTDDKGILLFTFLAIAIDAPGPAEAIAKADDEDAAISPPPAASSS